MLASLQETLFVLGGTHISAMHLLAFFATAVAIGWTYLKGMPLLGSEEEEEGYEHKPLQELREPPLRDLVHTWGKNLSRTLKHDKRVIGKVDRELTYWVSKDTPESKQARENTDDNGHSMDNGRPGIIPDHLSSQYNTKGMERVSIYYMRPDKLHYNLAKKFIGLPENVYDIVIIPDRFIIDASSIVLDKNVNMVKYAGIDTVWCSEVRNLFKSFLQNDIGEQVDENIVNFLRRITHFDTEQAKKTQFKKFDTEMEKARWGAKEQQDASNV